MDGQALAQDGEGAVIFYSVYECDEAWVAYDEEEAESYSVQPTDVDTAAAGANVVLADGSVNRVNGSYVARTYKEGTTKKLHKYDGAFYSRMSMNIDGEAEGTGSLSIIAENEGLDSELHLTINGGQISIQGQNDGINTNEENVSITTINGGLGEEGDGIDSNGHIVINGGAVYSMASDHSPNGGLDADGQILINGGQVTTLGVRNDTVSADSNMELSFASALPAGAKVELEGTSLSFTLEKGAQSILYSAPELKEDVSYTLKVDGKVQQYIGHGGGFGGGRPGGMDFQPPEGQEPPEGGFQPHSIRERAGSRPSCPTDSGPLNCRKDRNVLSRPKVVLADSPWMRKESPPQISYSPIVSAVSLALQDKNSTSWISSQYNSLNVVPFWQIVKQNLPPYHRTNQGY